MTTPKKQKIVVTNVYYDEIREDFIHINKVMQAQIAKVRRLLERLPLEMRVELDTTNPTAPQYDGMSIITIVNPAIRAFYKNHQSITEKEWMTLQAVYAEIPKGYVAEGTYVRVGEIRTTLDPECVEMVKEITHYLMDVVCVQYESVKVPYLDRRGSPKIIATLAVIYTSRMYLPVVEDLL